MPIDTVDILIPLVLELENKGFQANLVHFDFTKEEDEDFKLLKSSFPKNSSQEIRAAIKAALANEYLAFTQLGSTDILKLTTKGFYAGKSKQQMITKVGSQTSFKKISNLIEEHNGLLTLYAAIVGTLGFLIGIFKHG